MSNKKIESLQEKIDRLGEMMGFFDGDDFDIEQALTRYKAAETLSDEIAAQLSEVKNEITVLKERFDQAS